MDKPGEKRLTPRDATGMGIALLVIAGASVILFFQFWERGPAGNQPQRLKSIFEGLVLKHITLTIREYSALQETGQPFGLETYYEDAQTVRSRPVKYLPPPPPRQRTPLPTSPGLHESLYEEIRSQLEVAGIAVNQQLPPPEEPGKETMRQPPSGPAGNGYLRMEIETEHTPDIVTFQIACHLYRDMHLPGSDITFEIPVTMPRTPRHRVRKSDFRAALSYEVEQILLNRVTRPYTMTGGERRSSQFQ